MNITLTDKATGRLKEIISSKGENLALRVMVRTGGCSGYEYGMALERNPRPDDAVADQGGIKVVVDPNSLALLDGSTIDYVESIQGGGFAINNPNVAPSCGCGSHGDSEGSCGEGCGCGH